MTFDAGAIEATLTLKRDQFQRDVNAARADYDKLRAELSKDITIKVKTDVEGGHRSRVEAQGQGLLGSDPTLLKKLEQSAAAPGGIGLIGTGTDQTLQRLLRQQLQNQLRGGSPQLGAGVSGTDTQRVVQDVTQNVVRQATAGTVTQNVRQVQVGPGISAPGEVTEKVRVQADDASADAAGSESGSHFSSSFKSRTIGLVTAIFKGGGGGGGSNSADDAGRNYGYHFIRSFLSNTTFGKTGALATGIASAMATLPALGGFTGIGMGVALIGGLTAKLAAASPQLKSAFTSLFGGQNAAGKQVTGSLTTTIEAAFAPMVPAITKILGQVTQLVHAILPQLTSIFKTIAPQLQPIFNSLAGVIKQVLDLMSAAAPAFAPFVDTLLGLVKDIFPGLIELVKATVPVMGTLAQVFEELGKDLSGFFRDMAPAVADSAQVLKAVLGAIGQLLPIIGTLASVFAKLLGPVIVAFTKAFEAVEPIIVSVGEVLGKLAAAVIGSLASSLKLVADLIIAISPGLKVFAQAFASVFQVLENSGVMFVLANALDEVLKPLAKVIEALLVGLAPVLPQIINLFAQFVALLAGQAAAVLSALLKLLLPLVPTFTEIVRWLTTLLEGALKPMLPVLAGLVIAWKLLTLAMATNPFVAIGIAIAILVTLIVKYHAQIWNVIVKTWDAIVSFLKGTWNDFLNFAKQWWPLLLGVGGVIYKYHEQIWQFIQNIWNTIFGWLKGVWNSIKNFANDVWSGMKTNASNAWNSMFSTIKNVWGDIVSFFEAIPGKILGAFSRLGSGMYAIGKTAITSIWNGAKSIAGDIEHFFTSFADGIISIFKKIWGWFSPSSVMFEGGKSLMEGLFGGIKAHAFKAENIAAQTAAGITGALTPGGTAGQNAALARRMYPEWSTGQNWLAWNAVEMREAGWNSRAQNPGSGALGIAQALGHGVPGGGGSLGNEYGGYGLNLSGDRSANSGGAGDQIVWMHNYIRSIYGTPEKAWAHEQAYGWYDKGGPLPPGTRLVTNRTGGMEEVLTPEERRAFIALAKGANGDDIGRKLDQLIACVKASGPQMGAAMGRVLNGTAHQAMTASIHGAAQT